MGHTAVLVVEPRRPYRRISRQRISFEDAKHRPGFGPGFPFVDVADPDG